MRLFDSHAHLTDDRFADDRAHVLQRAVAAGVTSLVTIASDLEDARLALGLATPERPRVRATAGVHPHTADRLTPEALADLNQLARREEIVAIGETGLDFHYENAPRTTQIEAFRAQAELAAQLGFPLVVHSRQADADTASVIREFEGRVHGVLHCFSGGTPLLEVGLAAGWSVSLSGIVTFKNFTDHEHVRRIPHDRLLVETDSPYLAPVPMRGRRNEPAFVEHVVRRVAEMRAEDAADVAEVTYRNACAFYGLPEVPTE